MFCIHESNHIFVYPNTYCFAYFTSIMDKHCYEYTDQIAFKYCSYLENMCILSNYVCIRMH